MHFVLFVMRVHCWLILSWASTISWVSAGCCSAWQFLAGSGAWCHSSLGAILLMAFLDWRPLSMSAVSPAQDHLQICWGCVSDGGVWINRDVTQVCLLLCVWFPAGACVSLFLSSPLEWVTYPVKFWDGSFQGLIIPPSQHGWVHSSFGCLCPSQCPDADRVSLAQHSWASPASG